MKTIRGDGFHLDDLELDKLCSIVKCHPRSVHAHPGADSNLDVFTGERLNLDVVLHHKLSCALHIDMVRVVFETVSEAGESHRLQVLEHDIELMSKPSHQQQCIQLRNIQPQYPGRYVLKSFELKTGNLSFKNSEVLSRHYAREEHDDLFGFVVADRTPLVTISLESDQDTAVLGRLQPLHLTIHSNSDAMSDAVMEFSAKYDDKGTYQPSL